MKSNAETSVPAAPEGFLALQPVIERHAAITFRHLPPGEREEAVAEARAAGLESYLSLIARGHDPLTFPTNMAIFAALHVKNGRHVGSRTSCKDVLSELAQQRRGFRVHSLPDDEVLPWGEALLDNSHTPIPDQVAFRFDFPAFLETLTERDRQMIRVLAQGHAANEAADRFRVSPGRITQLRQQWQREWHCFIGEGEEERVGRVSA